MEFESQCVLTIDVEEWFHFLEVPSAPHLSDWIRLPSRVEHNFRRLLELAGESGVRCTCFFLGWIAERYPGLVTSAAAGGHEIASHGWAHRLVHSMTPQEFYEDAVRSKDVLEQIAGRRVLGYRAAGFSLYSRTSWLIDELLRAGYRYDASLFPARRAHGGWQNGHYAPYALQRPSEMLMEFPASTRSVFGQPLCFFGGGYLRLFPIRLIRKMARDVLREGRPVIFYVHPREIDPGQPRLPMKPWRRFKSYVNLDTTEAKLRKLLSTFEFTTIERLLERMNGAAGLTKAA
jgi:polysaccharide deacetylase family protein (PEP-CTERM system associated)